MHEKRNFVIVLLLVVALAWAILAWFVLNPETTVLLWLQRVVAFAALVALAGWLFYALKVEDKLPDHLCETVGEMYYDVGGLSFMATVRNREGRAYLCVFYQNQYENPVQAVVHLRPPDDSFIIRPGMRDVHIAFQAGGGDFGVINQPIAVPEHLQGEVIEVMLGAASFYPRSQGARLRRHAGMRCGAMLVDWGGSAFKSGVHEVSGEIELQQPARLHLSMPKDVEPFATGNETWRQELIVAGVRS
ncbi:MAG: hypothetical protein GY715_12555 [Planctomycetes bacterium]|nr:hypothetical protein [Planctomycetota bacterium]